MPFQLDLDFSNTAAALMRPISSFRELSTSTANHRHRTSVGATLATFAASLVSLPFWAETVLNGDPPAPSPQRTRKSTSRQATSQRLVSSSHNLNGFAQVREVHRSLALLLALETFGMSFFKCRSGTFFLSASSPQKAWKGVGSWPAGNPGYRRCRHDRWR